MICPQNYLRACPIRQPNNRRTQWGLSRSPWLLVLHQIPYWSSLFFSFFSDLTSTSNFLHCFFDDTIPHYPRMNLEDPNGSGKSIQAYAHSRSLTRKVHPFTRTSTRQSGTRLIAPVPSEHWSVEDLMYFMSVCLRVHVRMIRPPIIYRPHTALPWPSVWLAERFSFR